MYVGLLTIIMDIDFIKEKFHLSDIVANLLMEKGFDTEKKITEFLFNRKLRSPYLLPNIDKAVARIKQSIDNDDMVVVFGDYDCDGIGAITILYKTLKKLTNKVAYFVPHRKRDGYGIKWEALTRACTTFKPQLIISVDCGISSYQEIARAKEEFGVEFIITDHHALPETLPDTIIVNPHLTSFDALSGAGVAFKLACALTSEEEAYEYIDICALSTIADVVPLVGENRTIVKLGLEKMNKRDVSLGLKTLIKVAGIKNTDEIKTYDVAFRLAPRLNSAGRLDSAEMSIKLLTSNNASEIAYLADRLDENNKLRQTKCSEIFEDALNKLKDYDIATNRVIILKDDNWDLGVIGIVASKLVEKFDRPVILLSKRDELYSGSSRSIEGIDMFAMLSASKDILDGYGGHSMAAGLHIKEENIPELMSRCKQFYDSCGIDSAKEKLVSIKSEEIDLDLVHELRLLEPFGAGNPQPIFNLVDKVFYSRMGTQNHLKSKLGARSELLAFGKGESIDFLNNCIDGQHITIERNVFQNVEKAMCKFQGKTDYLYNIDDKIITASYIENTARIVNSARTYKKRKYVDSGRLYISFDKDNFNDFFKSHTCLKKYVLERDNLSVDDAIVLAPNIKFDYSYFNEIVFIDYVPKGLYQYLNNNFAGEIVLFDNKELQLEKIDILTLRGLYKDIANALNGQIMLSTRELYNNFFADKYDFIQFITGFFVLKELSCVTINNDRCISISQNKVDLDQSYIWQMVKL